MKNLEFKIKLLKLCLQLKVEELNVIGIRGFKNMLSSKEINVNQRERIYTILEKFSEPLKNSDYTIHHMEAHIICSLKEEI